MILPEGTKEKGRNFKDCSIIRRLEERDKIELEIGKKNDLKD